MSKSWTAGADFSFCFIHDCATGETRQGELPTLGALGGAFAFWDEPGEDIYDGDAKEGGGGE